MATNPPLRSGPVVQKPQTRTAAAPQRGFSRTSATAIAAVLPFTHLIELKLVGTLFLQDLLAVPLLLLLFLQVPNKIRLLQPLKPFLALVAIWFLGAVISDLVGGSPTEDLARGWSKITLFAVHTLVLWLLSRGDVRILAIYLFFTGVAYIFAGVVFPDPLQQIEPWKFGVGNGFLLVIGCMGVWIGNRNVFLKNLPLVLTGVIALVSLLLNARSLFAIALLSVLYSLGASLINNRPAVQKYLNRWSFFLVILSGLLASQALVAGYGELASQGVLGEAARSKYEMQTGANMSLLQGGRPESLVSVQAIKDSPWIGHGSWARDRYYTNLFFDELKWRGLLSEEQWWIFNQTQNDLIPSHSHLLGSWVESGILGVPVWILALIISFEALYAVLKSHSVPSLLVTSLAFAVIWDVLFSPFAADGRILKAAQLCVLISVTYSMRISSRQTRQKPGGARYG